MRIGMLRGGFWGRVLFRDGVGGWVGVYMGW